MNRRNFLKTMLGAMFAPAIVTKAISAEPKEKTFTEHLKSWANAFRGRPQLLATDIVGVQPMSEPSGMVFYLDFIDGSKPREKVPAITPIGRINTKTDQELIDDWINNTHE